MKYIIIELQTTNGTMALDSTVKSTYETAEQEYHRRLMYAAVSSVHLHAVTILGENGKEIKHECYDHRVPEVEEEVDAE